MLPQLLVNRAVPRALRAFSSVEASSSGTAGTPAGGDVRKRIDDYVKGNKVVVFMKGTQQEPMCGFSRNVKLVLDFHQVPFKDYNVLADSELREGVKSFSDWPTIPQVYVNGKFVGGSDILVQMHKDGEITDFFESNSIESKFSGDQKGNASDTGDSKETKSPHTST